MGDIAEEDEASALDLCLSEQGLDVAGVEHGGFVDHPDFCLAAAAVDGTGVAAHLGDGHYLDADRVAQYLRAVDLEPSADTPNLRWRLASAKVLRTVVVLAVPAAPWTSVRLAVDRGRAFLALRCPSA